jgi:hypothetical protein
VRASAAALLLLLAACSAPSSAHNVRLTPEEERVLRPLPNPPDRVRTLVEQGDEFFLKGIPSWRTADPETGHDWPTNAAAAKDYYARARTQYLTAQSEYASPSPVPPPLLDRVRECVMRLAALERWIHSVPRR